MCIRDRVLPPIKISFHNLSHRRIIITFSDHFLGKKLSVTALAVSGCSKLLNCYGLTDTRIIPDTGIRCQAFYALFMILIPGPIVLDTLTLLTYCPLAAAGLALMIAFIRTS